MARRLNATATAEGLTPTQAQVLGTVTSLGPIPLAELTEFEGLNPTMTSRVVSKLDELGLVTRQADPADLRAVVVEATRRGRTAHEHIKGARSAAVRDCLEQLPEPTAATLLAAVPALEQLAEELRVRMRPRSS